MLHTAGICKRASRASSGADSWNFNLSRDYKLVGEIGPESAANLAFPEPDLEPISGHPGNSGPEPGPSVEAILPSTSRVSNKS